jgi:chromosome segregation ATPase
MAVDLAADNTRLLVKRAADELLADGERPTVASVRNRIGRGSASTINEALREWWTELSQRFAKARSQPDLPGPLVDATNQLWGAALEHAHSALAEYRGEADRKVAEAADAAAAALLARDESEKKLLALQHDYKELADARIDLERRLTVEAERRQVAETRIREVQADADRRIQEGRDRVRQIEELLERERARYDSMESRLTLQVEEHKAARSKAETKHKDDASAWRKEKNQLLEQNQEIHQRFAETQGRNSALAEQLATLRGEHQVLQHDKERLLTERAETQTRLAQARNIEESLRSEINVLQQMIQVVEEDRIVLRRDLEAARKALTDIPREPVDSSA